MSSSTISKLQFVRMETNVQKKGIAEDKADAAAEQHENAVEHSYQEMKEQAKKQLEASDTQNKGNLLGTIFGGPLIGTAIGGAIAGWANDGDEDAARNAEKEWKMTDMTVEREADKFSDANKDIEQANKDTQATQKFENELRDHGMEKTQI